MAACLAMTTPYRWRPGSHAAMTHDVWPAKAPLSTALHRRHVAAPWGAALSEFVLISPAWRGGLGSFGSGAIRPRDSPGDGLIWRKAWYPPGDRCIRWRQSRRRTPNQLSLVWGLPAVSQAQIDASRLGDGRWPTNGEPGWCGFSKECSDHHGGSAIMAHDAAPRGTNPQFLAFRLGR